MVRKAEVDIFILFIFPVTGSKIFLVTRLGIKRRFVAFKA